MRIGAKIRDAHVRTLKISKTDEDGTLRAPTQKHELLIALQQPRLRKSGSAQLPRMPMWVHVPYNGDSCGDLFLYDLSWDGIFRVE